MLRTSDDEDSLKTVHLMFFFSHQWLPFYPCRSEISVLVAGTVVEWDVHL